MNLTHRIENNICLISLTENLVSHNVIQVQKYIQPFIDDENIIGIILNFEKVIYIDSTGFGFLISIFQSLRKRQAKLGLCQVDNKIKEFFKRMKIDRFLDVYLNEKEAMAALD